MTELSPAAQAVMDGVCDNTEPDCDIQHLIAAALRAAALELYSEEVETCGGCSYALVIEVDDLLALADELEGQG